MPAVIEADRVGKTYRSGESEVGLHELSVNVEEGRMLALIGPNGAGKTTAIRGLSTLLQFDHGAARVAGHDVRSEAKKVRERIALVGQSAAVDDDLTATANLILFARLRGLNRRTAKQRARELTAQFGLTDEESRVVRGFSGGMRRRLDVAAAMILRPQVLFVDEPTTGLDPAARLDLWRMLRDLLREGTTILLTTQYLEEADALADEVMLLDRGQVVAHGSPDSLKNMVSPPVIHISFETNSEASRALPSLCDIDPAATLDIASTTVTLHASGTDALVRSIRTLDGIASPTEVTMRRPTLDEVFLTLTGNGSHNAQEDA